MKNLVASGFLFVGGAVMMLAEDFAHWAPVVGSIFALAGGGMLVFYLLSEEGKY